MLVFVRIFQFNMQTKTYLMHAQIIKAAVACAWYPYLTFSMLSRYFKKKTLIVITSCRKKKYDMQILKMTWKIDFVEISMKKSKRGIGSQVRPRGVIGLLVERNKMQVFDKACTRMTSFLRDGVIPCFCRNIFCLSVLSRS